MNPPLSLPSPLSGIGVSGIPFPLGRFPCWASVLLGSPAMGLSLTLGRCLLLLLLLFLLSLPVPEAGERGWGEGDCIQSAKAGPRPWPGPHRMGRGGGGAVSMEEGDGVKQRRNEVGSDRETELKPVGLPAVRKREEG